MHRAARPIPDLVGPSMGASHNVPRATGKWLLDNQYHWNGHFTQCFQMVGITAYLHSLSKRGMGG